MNMNPRHPNSRTQTRLAVVAALGLFSSHAAYAVTADNVACTGCVNTADLAGNAVNAAKIANGAVTEAKLAASVMATINALSAKVAALETANAALQTKVTAQQNLLAYFNLTETADPSTGDAYPTVQISGANLQIVNGLGSTNTKNGTGNLIVGYNESQGQFRCSTGGYGDQPTCTANGGIWSDQHRSGSHNIVAGEANNYSSWGGFVTGRWNTVNRDYASVSGGAYNTASGYGSSVSGGQNNTASGQDSSVSGGADSIASGASSSVSGGKANAASGVYSSVSGGYVNTASGSVSSVSGGHVNTASGLYSSVSGGWNHSSVGNYDWSAGALFQTQ